MTPDFFADLESELRDAHRRDARRSPLARLRPVLAGPRRVLPALAVAAVLVIAIVGIASLADQPDEREAAVPSRPAPEQDGGGVAIPDGGQAAGHARDDPPDEGGSTPYGPGSPGGAAALDADPPLAGDGCGGSPVRPADDPPRAVLDLFAVLRQDGSSGTGGFSFAGPIRDIFPRGGRIVGLSGRRYVVVPVRIGCDDPQPGACVGEVADGGTPLACATARDIEARGLLVRAEDADELRVFGLVTDGVRAVRLGRQNESSPGGSDELEVHRNVFARDLSPFLDEFLGEGSKLRIRGLVRR